MPRRHDIDALRVIAFALLIVYHVGMVYVADWGFHVKSAYLAEWLQWPMIALNRWRMPLLFMISGIALGLARIDRAPLRFAARRCWRLLLPLAFGMFVVVAVQAYCEGLANGRLQPGFWAFLLRYWQLRPWPSGSFTGAEFGITWNHLWYLAYLWLYTMLLVALLPLRTLRTAEWLAGWRWPTWLLLSLPVAWLAMCRLVLAPRFPETHALFGDWTVHAQSLPLFLAGYAIAGNIGFWERIRALRWPVLAIALACITIELTIRAGGRYLPPDAAVPAWVPWAEVERIARAAYTWTALLAIFGWGQVLLDRRFRWLPYCTEAVYPWYILHQSLIVPLAFWLSPVQLGPVLEPALVLGGTVGGCLLLHELVIRRAPLLRPLFGLKRGRATAHCAAARVSHSLDLTKNARLQRSTPARSRVPDACP